MWQRDPSVLHDSVDAVEGEAGADPSEQASCDESEKFRLRGVRGCSPSIATSSNDASSRTDAWEDRGEFGCGVRNVVRTGPTWCGVRCRPPVAGVRSVPVVPVGFILGQGMLEPGVCSRGLLFICTGVQISMSPSGVGGGDRGLAGVPSWDPGGVSLSIPVLGADVGCETYSSSHPHMDSSGS